MCHLSQFLMGLIFGRNPPLSFFLSQVLFSLRWPQNWLCVAWANLELSYTAEYDTQLESPILLPLPPATGWVCEPASCKRVFRVMQRVEPGLPACWTNTLHPQSLKCYQQLRVPYHCSRVSQSRAGPFVPLVSPWWWQGLLVSEDQPIFRSI